MVIVAMAMALVVPDFASGRTGARTDGGKQARMAAQPPVAPTPRPRPASAPSGAARPAEKAAADAAEGAASPQPPSACRLALSEAVAIAPSVPPIRGPGACGGDDLVQLEAVVLPDSERVAVKPVAVLRCQMASAIADWIRTGIAPLAAGLSARLDEIDTLDAFDCRARNRVSCAKLSEHGRANALDVAGLRLANGRWLLLTDHSAPREFREKVLASACGRFTTVLGPGSDGYHQDHIHLDLADRHNGYRICQWSADEPLREVAPLPTSRPPDAPGAARVSEKVRQLKVQRARPPPASLSPAPFAGRPATVGRAAIHGKARGAKQARRDKRHRQPALLRKIFE